MLVKVLPSLTVAVTPSVTPDRGLDWGQIERQLRRLLPQRAVVAKRQELLAYDCDGLTLHRHQPRLVVLPETTDQVAAVVRCCNDHRLPIERKAEA